MEIDLVKILGLLWLRRYFIIVVVAAAGFLAFGLTLMLPPGYTANIEFLMQASGGKQGGTASALGLSSLAGQFGLDMAGNQKIFEIFPRILESRTFLAELKDVKVEAAENSGKPLGQFLIPNPDPKVPFDVQLLDKLRKMIVLDKDKDGVNILTIKAGDPVFTAYLANTLVSRLEKYYSTMETKKARQNLDFLESKHKEAQGELSGIAEQLRIFKEQNRETVTPFLIQKLYWLQMDQRIREEKYLLLTREFESAKIDYEKVKPIVVVVDSAIVPFAKSEPRKKVTILIATIFAACFSVAWIIAMEWFRRAKAP
ncbi:MAG: Wzz/FepE/Etk N-terminal domain-containing protein [Fibrobacteria bacterium]